MKVALDSWAILRFLEGQEPAASAVAGLLEEQKPVVSWINKGGVFCFVRQRTREKDALAAIRDIEDVVLADLPNSDRIMEAARIKADHPMAHADAFAAATAVHHEATLWTGDPELLLADANWAWRDLC